MLRELLMLLAMAQETPIGSGAGAPMPDLFQAAVDAAPDGAVLRADDYLPKVKYSINVRTDRSLTFVGGVFASDAKGPAIHFETQNCSFPPDCWNSASRTMRLLGITIIPGKNTPAVYDIEAGGLGHLIVEDSHIRSAKSGIYVSVGDLLAVRRSIIQANDAGFVQCTTGGFDVLGYEAIRGGYVGIWDSWIEGGDAPTLDGPSPARCIPNCSGRGGLGVWADVLGYRNSTLRGGHGSKWTQLGCTGPTGHAYQAETVL